MHYNESGFRRNIMKSSFNLSKSVCTLCVGLVLGFSTFEVFAGNTDVVAVATTVSSQLNSLATLLGRISYAAGIALAIVSLMKFKAHKDNPQQEPIGKAVTYLAVAGGLLFLPTVMDVASLSLFGSSGTAGSNIQITNGT
ncbi:MAG: icmD [Francisellaceae bacterium]|nr:icmD [Francisellaceae bacterium]